MCDSTLVNLTWALPTLLSSDVDPQKDINIAELEALGRSA